MQNENSTLSQLIFLLWIFCSLFVMLPLELSIVIRAYSHHLKDKTKLSHKSTKILPSIQSLLYHRFIELRDKIFKNYFHTMAEESHSYHAFSGTNLY